MLSKVITISQQKGGTGKTTLAMELAFSNANDNEKVLILCFNRGLNEYLSQKYSKDNFTISTFHQLLIDT